MSKDLKKAFRTVSKFVNSNKKKFEECYAILQEIQFMERKYWSEGMRLSYHHVKIEWNKYKIVLCDKLESRNFYITFAEISDIDLYLTSLKEKQIQLKLQMP